MFLFKRVKIRSYEVGLHFRDGEFKRLAAGRSPLAVRPALARCTSTSSRSALRGSCTRSST